MSLYFIFRFLLLYLFKVSAQHLLRFVNVHFCALSDHRLFLYAFQYLILDLVIFWCLFLSICQNILELCFSKYAQLSFFLFCCWLFCFLSKLALFLKLLYIFKTLSIINILFLVRVDAWEQAHTLRIIDNCRILPQYRMRCRILISRSRIHKILHSFKIFLKFFHLQNT